MTLKRWKHRGLPLLIPDQHEPGVQRPFGEGSKSRRRVEAARQQAKAAKKRGGS